MDNELVILNNLAAESIDLRDFSTAISILEEALKKVSDFATKLYASGGGGRNTGVMAESSLNSARNDVAFFLNQGFEMQITPPDPCSSACLHTQGIYLTLEPLAYSPDPMANATIICSIVLYNQALAFHLGGILDAAGSVVNEANLRQATYLYTRIGSLLVAGGRCETKETGRAVLDFLAMATLNNLGYIAFEMADYATSTMCYNQLVAYAAVAMTNDNDYRSKRSSICRLMEMHKSCFLLNAISLSYPKQAPAA